MPRKVTKKVKDDKVDEVEAKSETKSETKSEPPSDHDQHSDSESHHSEKEAPQKTGLSFRKRGDDIVKAKKPVPARVANSVTNFRFSEILSLEKPVSEATTTELLQYLVAKAKTSGQIELYKVMNQTLKASNHECEFPKTYSQLREMRGEAKFTPRQPKRFG